MVCDYVSFCTEILIPYELVKDFPNNKPRISYNTKGLLHRKQVAFKQEGLNAVREIKKMVEVDMSKNSLRYKDKIETHLNGSNLGLAWYGYQIG